MTIRKHRIAAGGRHAHGIDIVFDRDRNAVQKAAASLGLAFGVEVARDFGGARVDREHRAQAWTLLVVRLNPFQIEAHEPFVGERAGIDGGLNVRDARGQQIE
jgi:hypothetical protein